MEKPKTTVNNSCIGKNDESNSMYFSFNTSTLSEFDDKTLEAEKFILDENNSTEHNDISANVVPIISTVKKCINPSIKILCESKMHSSTPTKYFSPRPISKTCDGSFGVSLLPKEYLTQNDKENINNESTCTKNIKELNLQLEELKLSNEHSNKKSKRMLMDVLPEENVLTESRIPIKKQLDYSKDEFKWQNFLQFSKTSPNEPDLFKNQPLRISDNKPSLTSERVEIPIKNSKSDNQKILDKNYKRNQIKEIYSENVANSKETAKLKMEKRRTIYVAYTFPTKSINNHITKSTHDNITIKRQPRLSVTKTTLNSPGIINKNIRRTICIKNDLRKSIVGQTKLFTDSSKKLKTTISVESKNGSSSVSQTKLSSSLKQKVEKTNKENTENKCKFCDKQFAISKALQIHLLENCLKIPHAIKKKLLMNDKAEDSRKSTSTVKLPTKTFNASKSSSTLTSCSITSNESVSFNTAIQIEAEFMPPPSSTKIKKKIPHSGIFRTPNKLLKCQLCLQNFNNVYEYTEHILSHSEKENDFC